MKSYPLSLAPDYCSDWTPADGIREFCQNALDGKGQFQYHYDPDCEVLYLTSVGVTLEPSTLLLGTTSKANENSSVGGYGEGFKIGMLVLCREGIDVVVLNGDLIWTPRYEFSDLYNSTSLVVHETINEENVSHGNNLTFIVRGVDSDLWEEVSEKCLYLQEDIGEVIETSSGRILKDKEGKLFVGGLYVCDTRLKYGYDFNPDQLKLNRDRKSTDEWNLTMQTGRMWLDASSDKDVAGMMFENIEDTSKIQYLSPNSSLRDASLEKFNEEYQGKFLAEDQEEVDVMISSGVSSEKIVILNDSFSSVVRGSSKYTEPEIDEVLSLEESLEIIIENFRVAREDHYDQAIFCDLYDQLSKTLEEKGV